MPIGSQGLTPTDLDAVDNERVAEELSTAAAKRTVRIVQVYGGRAYEPQIEDLERGAEVVVGTPGRLIDLMERGVLDLAHVTTVVLDEADEMLDLGFLPDVEKILARTRAQGQDEVVIAQVVGLGDLLGGLGHRRGDGDGARGVVDAGDGEDDFHGDSLRWWHGFWAG